jgi:hypothetical protein
MSKLQYKLLAIIMTGVVIVVFGIIYFTQQQSLRIGANDPQIQIAEDSAAALDADSVPESFMNGKVDISNWIPRWKNSNRSAWCFRKFKG